MKTRATSLLLFAALAACGVRGEDRDARDDAGARDAATAPAVEPLDTTTCTDCHATVTHDWLASAHHAAFTNDVFQNEWLLHRDPWCVRCHAPETNAYDPEGPTAAAGVSCVSCHVPAGSNEIVSSHAGDRAPHAVRVDPSFATEAQCARCHDVKFPPSEQFHGARVAPGQVLQRTITEWRASGATGPCQSCHMERGSHLFPGGRDEALLAHALRVTATARCDDGATHVHLVLESDHVGHAVPTGDVFRRLEVHASLAGRSATRETAALTRRFAVGPDHLLRETRDDRVPAGGSREVDLELRGCARSVSWDVEWYALDADVADRRALSDADVRRTVAHGDVAVARR